jgi:hypothetical protein
VEHPEDEQGRADDDPRRRLWTASFHGVFSRLLSHPDDAATATAGEPSESIRRTAIGPQAPRPASLAGKRRAER